MEVFPRATIRLALDAAHEPAENVRRAWCFPLIEVCSEMKKRQRDSEDTGAE
jgi:hypothetical protein